MAAPTVDFDVRGMLDAQQTLELLSLPASKRRRLLNNAAKRVRTRNRKRISELPTYGMNLQIWQPLRHRERP